MILLGMIHPSKSLANKTDFNPIQKRHFQGFSQMGGGGKDAPSLKSVRYLL